MKAYGILICDMKQNKSRLGLGMVVGAVAGAVAGLFLAPKAGKELRDDAMKLYKKLQKEDPKVLAKKIFGDVSDESQKFVKKAYQDLSVQLADLKKTSSKIDTAKYKEAVKNVVTTIKDEGNIPDGSMKKLVSYLEGDEKRMFASTSKKSTKKPASKAKKSA